MLSYPAVVYCGGIIRSGYIGSTLRSVGVIIKFNSSAALTQWSLEPGPDSIVLKWNTFSLSVVNVVVKALSLSLGVIAASDALTKPLS